MERPDRFKELVGSAQGPHQLAATIPKYLGHWAEARMLQNARNLLGADLAQRPAIGARAAAQKPERIRMRGIGEEPT